MRENLDISSGNIDSIVQLEHMLTKKGVRFWRRTADGRGLLVTDEEAAYLRGGGPAPNERTRNVKFTDYFGANGPESYVVYPANTTSQPDESTIEGVVNSLTAAGYSETAEDPDFWRTDPRREQELRDLGLWSE